jgi:hypothetical protein
MTLMEVGQRRRSVVASLRNLADRIEAEKNSEPLGYDATLQFADGETHRHMCYEIGFNHAIQVGILMCQVDHHIDIMKGN